MNKPVTLHDLSKFRKITTRFYWASYRFTSRNGFDWIAKEEVVLPTKSFRQAYDFYQDPFDKYADNQIILGAINYMIKDKKAKGWIRFYDENGLVKTIKTS